MSRRDNVAYYNIIHYKLLMFALLLPGVLADHNACARDLSLLYILLGLLLLLVLVHGIAYLTWSRRLLSALKKAPPAEVRLAMQSLHT